jgi:hypothetical protein
LRDIATKNKQSQGNKKPGDDLAAGNAFPAGIHDGDPFCWRTSYISYHKLAFSFHRGKNACCVLRAEPALPALSLLKRAKATGAVWRMKPRCVETNVVLFTMHAMSFRP